MPVAMHKKNQLGDLNWDDFQQLTPHDKGALFMKGSRPYHTLIAQQFELDFLERLGELATRIRKVAKTKGGMNFLQDLLSEKSAMLYFTQPSTRTFLSFYAACQIVGMKPAEVRGTTTSSELKGESPEDTVRTFSSYFDIIIMRHAVGGFAERIAWLLSHSDRPIPVVNAGSGKDQHPTQALLDVYTLQRSFEHRDGVAGKHVVFVGDLARGRTVRSLARLIALYPDVRMSFVAPEALRIGDDILEALDAAGVPYDVRDDLKSVLPEADAVYMTRIQDEWDEAGESQAIDTSSFRIGRDELGLLREDAVIMHPLPRREEISTEVDSDPRAVYWRQVRNGMWIRAALFLMTFEREGEVDRYYLDLMR